MIAIPIWLVTLLASALVSALGALVVVTWRLSSAAAKLDEAIRRLAALEERMSKVHELDIAIAELRAEVVILRREHDREPTGRHAAVTPPHGVT